MDFTATSIKFSDAQPELQNRPDRRWLTDLDHIKDEQFFRRWNDVLRLLLVGPRLHRCGRGHGESGVHAIAGFGAPVERTPHQAIHRHYQRRHHDGGQK